MVVTALEQLADGGVTPLDLLAQVNRLLAGLGPAEAPKEAKPSCVLAMYSDPIARCGASGTVMSSSMNRLGRGGHDGTTKPLRRRALHGSQACFS